MIEMSKLREILEVELHNHNLLTNLTNQTDDKLGLLVSRFRYQTILNLTRHSHNPLEIEVVADHTLAAQKDVIRSIRPSSGRGTGMISGQYRWIWLLLIFGGIIISLVMAIADILASIIEIITPSWTDQQRIFGILGFIAIFIVIWMIIIPRMQKNRVNNLIKFNSQVLEIIVNRLQLLNDELSTSDIIRCWSCFEKIDPQDNVCIYCGVRQK